MLNRVSFFVFLVGLCLVLGAQGEEKKKGKSWVLLVAGSNGWYNYRHQADVYHSYQVVKSHGIPEENIVLMAYDDIAFDNDNPTPGIVINKPNGPDVYHGVVKDYTKENVNPQVFLDVLSGVDPKVGSRKVINSTAEDNVFVYFTDHGGPGILAFPDDTLDVLDLNKTIHKMQKAKRFKKLVFYIEACESGSMFDGVLQKNGNVYAMTASDPEHSSYACYYSDKYDTYLGDVYSVKWLEDSDKEDLHKENIQRQFKIVKRETNTSTVCEYGDRKVSLSFLSDFLGTKSVPPTDPVDSGPLNPISSRNVPMDLIRKSKNKALIRFAGAKRRFMEEIFDQIIYGIEGVNANIKKQRIQLKETNLDCYVDAVDAIHKKCFNLGHHSYALEFLKYFVNICQSVRTELVLQSIADNCQHLRHGMNKIM